MSAPKPVYVYGTLGSGNTQKAIQACSLMNIPYEVRLVGKILTGPEAEVPPGPKSPEYLRLNPLGLVPIIIDPNESPEPASQYGLSGENHCDEGLVVTDSAAILTYLAAKYNPAWYPVNDPVRIARINYWLTYAAADVVNSLMRARQHMLQNKDISPLTYPFVKNQSLALLSNIDALFAKTGSLWLLPGEAPTVADIAMFPYIALCEYSTKGDITLEAYPHLRAWQDRFKRLPGYLSINGVPDAAPL